MPDRDENSTPEGLVQSEPDILIGNWSSSESVKTSRLRTAGVRLAF